MAKDLGIVTAYGYAVQGGYTGTEAQFMELLANARGIVSIENTSTSGAVHTYTITYTDGTTQTYNVTDGEVTQAVLDAAVNDLKTDLSLYTGNDSCAYTKDKSVSESAPTTQSTELYWESVVISCTEGEVFNVKGWGGYSTRLWMFSDSNGNLLTKADGGTHASDYIKIVAPPNSAYLSCNSYYTQMHGSLIKEELLVDRVNRLERNTAELGAFVTPEMFGAIGDGVANDTQALQDMFDNSTQTIVLNGRYLVTSTIKSTKPRNIISFADADSYIHGSISGSLLEFERSDGDTKGYNNYYIKNINVINSGGGHGVSFINWGDYLSNMYISNCQFYASYDAQLGYGLYCENSMSHSLIANCRFRGNGIYGNFRDANVIFRCSVYGKGNGIVINPAEYGCLNNSIKNCTIVNIVGNAIQIIDGEQITIENNQIEYAGNDAQTATNKALVCIISDQRTSEHVIIRDNNFGGGTQVTSQIALVGALDTEIYSNRFVKLVGNNVTIDANSKRTRIDNSNYCTNNREGSATISQISCLNNGEGTIGIGLRIPCVTDEPTDNLYVNKTIDGFVEFGSFYLSSIANPNIYTLPKGYYNPDFIMWISALDPLRNVVVLQISNTGAVKIIGATTTGRYYPCGRYRCYVYE